MPNEVDQFLEGLDNQPKEDPFKQESEDPFASTEEKVITPKEEIEEKLPFHKDPKVQRYIQKEIEKATKNTSVETKFIQEVKQESDAADDVLTRIIGNDTPEKQSAIKDFKKVLNGMKDEAKQEALQEIQNQSEYEREAEIDAQNTLTEAFEELEEEFNVDLSSNSPIAKKTRNEFIDFVRRVAPKDEDGQVTEFPDFKETYQLFKEMRKPEPNTRAKELSSRSMQRSAEVSTSQKKDINWKNIDKIFQGLSN